jgi:hypothetical protein
MSQRIADASAKVARSSYLLPPGRCLLGRALRRPGPTVEVFADFLVEKLSPHTKRKSPRCTQVRGGSHNGHFRPNVKRLTPRRAIRVYGGASIAEARCDSSPKAAPGAAAAPAPPTWSAYHGWREPSDTSRRIGFCRRWSGPVGRPRPCRFDRDGARECGRAQSPLGRAGADGRRA